MTCSWAESPCQFVSAQAQFGLHPVVVAAEPALSVLCPEHALAFRARRQEAQRKAEREAARIFCKTCPGEIYLMTNPATGELREICERCRLAPLIALRAAEARLAATKGEPIDWSAIRRAGGSGKSKTATVYE